MGSDGVVGDCGEGVTGNLVKKFPDSFAGSGGKEHRRCGEIVGKNILGSDEVRRGVDFVGDEVKADGGGGVGLDEGEPVGDGREGRGVRHVEDAQNDLGVADVGRDEGAKNFTPGGVPEDKFDLRTVWLPHHQWEVINTHCWRRDPGCLALRQRVLYILECMY